MMIMAAMMTITVDDGVSMRMMTIMTLTMMMMIMMMVKMMKHR
jgi:hypothetical protein